MTSSSSWLSPLSTVNAAPSGQRMARTLTAQAMPRWNRADSEDGHGSTSWRISRPSSEVVQVSLMGHALHTEGLPR